MERWRKKGGFALAAAVFALVVVGGLISGVFMLGVLEQRLGWNTLKLHGAFAAADGGAAEIISQWDRDSYNQLAVGESVILGQRWMGTSGWYRGSVRRLNQQLFFITIHAYSRDSTAQQSVGLIARLKPIGTDFNAALKTQGVVKLGGSSSLSGNDAPPTGWTGCPATQSPRPALRLPPADSATIETGGCANYGCLSGSPKIQTDSTITSDSFTRLGDFPFSDLAALATKTLPGETYSWIGPSLKLDGGCNRSDPQNWGDPLTPFSPCGRYFPVVFINGDATIHGNSGQGVLIVDGNLTVDGGFQFYGATVVGKTLSITGSGGRFTGGVTAAGINLDPSAVVGSAVISYSSCALQKSFNASATAAPLGERGWMNLY